MNNIIPNEEILVPSFYINDGKGQTLSERLDDLKELRQKLADNMLNDMLTDFYANEQKQLNSCVKSINGETK